MSESSESWSITTAAASAYNYTEPPLTLHTIQVWYIDIGSADSTAQEKVKAGELYDMQMWIVAIAAKILPCLLLAVMSNMLIHKLRQVVV